MNLWRTQFNPQQREGLRRERGKCPFSVSQAALWGDVDGEAVGSSSGAGGTAGVSLGSVLRLFSDAPTPPTLEMGLGLCLVTGVTHQLHLAGVRQPRQKELSN